MKLSVPLALFLAAPLGGWAQPESERAMSPSAPTSRFRGFGITETLGEPSRIERLRSAAGFDSSSPLTVELVVSRPLIEPTPSELTFDDLDERISELDGFTVLVTLRGMPSSELDAPGWGSYVRAMAARYRGRVGGYVLGAPDDNAESPDVSTFVYLLKLGATQIRSEDTDALVFVGRGASAATEDLTAWYREGIGPYVDGIAIQGGSGNEIESDLDRNLGTILAAAMALDPSAQILATGFGLGDRSEEAVRRFLITGLQNLAAGVALTTFREGDSALPELDPITRRLSNFASGHVVPLDESESGLIVRPVAGAGEELNVEHRLLFDASASQTILVFWHEAARAGEGSIEVELQSFLPSAPELRDPGAGGELPVSDFDYDASRNVASVRVPVLDRPLVLVYPAPTSGASVTASVGLGVDEIIARHQQAQAGIDNAVDNYLATVRDEIHFRPTPVDSFDVIMERRFYLDREGSEWEELSFSLNGARWGSDRPAFPLLQPEKVLSLPLDLRLNQDYRYELSGEDSIRGHDCYVLRFEPTSSSRSLYSGRVWIDRTSFHKIQVEVVQTELSAPVVSNAETYRYQQQGDVDGMPVYLLTELSSKQLVLIAGRNLLVEKESRFYDVQVNSDAFDELRQTARNSERIMLRDTDEGLRYFVKQGGRRVVSEELTRSAKALAMGTTIDPSFDFPLPIFGLNYLDFDFLDRNAQFALLFGGVFALGNIQKSGLFGGPIDVSFDFFGIAVPGNDVIFDQDGEVEESSLRTVPATMGVNFGWQATGFQKVTARYDYRYDYFGRDETTSDEFVTPVSTVTNGFTLGYEHRRRGYSLLASGSFAHRAGWEPWGDVSKFDPDTQSYWKYRLVGKKDFFFKTFHKIHVDAGFFGGERLDRFTKYQFGLFDETRVRGVPSTAVRFSELVLARASYSFNVFDQFRFEVFYDRAWGDDPEQGFDRIAFSGLGAGFNVRGPWHTIVRADIGKALLPDVLSGAGSVVAQVLILKPL
jgi:hypothetical protein